MSVFCPLKVRQELIRRLCVDNAARFAVHGETAPSRDAMPLTSLPLLAVVSFPHFLSDLAVASAVAYQTDHTNRRRRYLGLVHFQRQSLLHF